MGFVGSGYHRLGRGTILRLKSAEGVGQAFVGRPVRQDDGESDGGSPLFPIAGNHPFWTGSQHRADAAGGLGDADPATGDPD